jgi:putative transposase
VATVARIACVSRQALYKKAKPTTRPQSRPIDDPIEQKIVDVCNDDDYRTDGYRMIAAIVSRLLHRPVNRKRVLRVMRKHKLIQRRKRPERRRRPGKFKVTRPDQLWHLDMERHEAL